MTTTCLTRTSIRTLAAGAREARVASAPVFQRRNGWEIVKDGVDYVLRDPILKRTSTADGSAEPAKSPTKASQKRRKKNYCE